MLKKLFYFVPLYLFLLLTISVNAAENDKIVTVNVFNNIYYGTLEEKDENTSVFSAYADKVTLPLLLPENGLYFECF